MSLKRTSCEVMDETVVEGSWSAEEGGGERSSDSMSMSSRSIHKFSVMSETILVVVVECKLT